MARPPIGELDAAFSSPDATPTPWAEAERVLERAEIFWVTTVRADGRPHVTPLIAAWLDGALYFGTGPNERKADNLRSNAHCVLTTGCNSFRDGLDLVLEGDAERVREPAMLQRVADRFVEKYDWRFEVRGDRLHEVSGPDPKADEGAGSAQVYRVAPAKMFAYGRGESYSATRWRF